MAHNKFANYDKQTELLKYRDLVLATIDYYLDNKLMQIKTPEFDTESYYKALKEQVEKHYQKGSLAKLKRWFIDLTQMPLETHDLKFNAYLNKKINYEIDVFESYFQKIDKVIFKGKITTDNQFHDVNHMVDTLCQAGPIYKERIELLNNLLLEYEQTKSRKSKKPNR